LLSTRESVLPSIQAYLVLDEEQVARELELDSRAEEAGRVLPPSNERAGAPNL
jgi:hypothetical protein